MLHRPGTDRANSDGILIQGELEEFKECTNLQRWPSKPWMWKTTLTCTIAMPFVVILLRVSETVSYENH